MPAAFDRNAAPAGVTIPPDRPQAGTVLLAAAVLLVAFLAYAVYPSLSPFVILAGLLYLLYPFRHDEVPRRLLWLGALFFAVWFFSAIIGVLAPFLIALFLAYILNPLVVLLEKRRVPRWLSTLLLMILLVGGVVAFGLFIVPVALDQFRALSAGAGALAVDASKAIESGSLVEFLGRFGVSGEKAKEVLAQNLTPKLEEMLTRLFAGLFDILSSVSSLAHQLLNIIIVPFVLFYLLLDFPLVVHRCTMLVPKRSLGRGSSSSPPGPTTLWGNTSGARCSWRRYRGRYPDSSSGSPACSTPSSSG